MSLVGNISAAPGAIAGAAAGSRFGIPGAIVGGIAGSLGAGYVGDRVYEAATGRDDEREKALALLNMYLAPEDVASVDRRIDMAQGQPMQNQRLENQRVETGMRALSPQEQQVQAQMMMQDARRQQAMQAKTQQDMMRAQMMQQQQY
jgi:hypothetical protein